MPPWCRFSALGWPKRLWAHTHHLTLPSPPVRPQSQAPRQLYDPLGQGSRAVAPSLKRVEKTPEDKAKDMEEEVHSLLEKSADAAKKEEDGQALERAKEAVRGGGGGAPCRGHAANAAPRPSSPRAAANACSCATARATASWTPSTWT